MNRRKLERSEKRTKIIHLNIFFLKEMSENIAWCWSGQRMTKKIRRKAKVCNNWIQNRGDTRHLFGPSPIIPLSLHYFVVISSIYNKSIIQIIC